MSCQSGASTYEPPARERGNLDKSPQGLDDPQAAIGQKHEPMTLPRMAEIVLAIDPDANLQGNAMRLSIEGVTITIVTDIVRNRMRAFTPVRSLDGISGAELYRMMQANFDSALDARYAVAKGYVVSAFIHPLAELEKEQFIKSLGQVVNLVLTYGTAFTSGALTYGGGDSRDLHRKLIEDLLKKGEKI